MNIYEVAKAAGVSTATVSRVLNGVPGVSPETRRRVQAVMDDCSYQPNAFARGLGFNSMSTVGLLCADVSDRYLAGAVSVLEKELREKQYDSFLCCTGREWEERKARIEAVLARHVDGLILIGSHFICEDEEKNAYITEAAKRVPLVLIGARTDTDNVYCVLCDDREAMENMTGLLLDRGRRNLVYLYDHASYSGLKKMEGFRDAHKKRGLTVKEENLLCIGGGEDPIRAAQNALEAYARPFDGVVASEDALAAGALKYAAARGLSVPGALCVTGYNDSEVARACTPELTGVDNCPETLCKKAVEVLMDVLKGREAEKVSVYPGKVVERQST